MSSNNELNSSVNEQQQSNEANNDVKAENEVIATNDVREQKLSGAELSSAQTIKYVARNGYKGVKFDSVETLPDNWINIDSYFTHKFTDFYYNPDNGKFYIKGFNANGARYVERKPDANNKVTVCANNGKYAHLGYNSLIKYINDKILKHE